jgi:hypothetical protein
MTLPAHRFLPAPLLRLAAGVVFLAVALPVTSCTDAIDAYCTTSCADPTSPPAQVAADHDACVTTLEGEEHQAEAASCDAYFQVYFQCEQQAGPGECGFGAMCSSEQHTLSACLAENDPDNLCNRGYEHVGACLSEPAEQSQHPCVGSVMCVSFCYVGATCEEISDYLRPQGMFTRSGLTRCIAACAFAQTDGTIGWIEDN